MKNVLKLSVVFFVVLQVATGAGTALGAVEFPEKPVNLIVPYGAGGGSDVFARTMAAAFGKYKLLPKPLVVENKPGGSGGIGFAYVASKKSNPYFMMSAVTSFLTTPLMGKSPVNYKSFTPLANLVFDEYMLVVRADARYKTMQDIVADAKANPRKLTIG